MILLPYQIRPSILLWTETHFVHTFEQHNAIHLKKLKQIIWNTYRR